MSGGGAIPERWRLGPAFVPKGRYIDSAFLELELEHLFPRAWLNACRLEEVPDRGSFVEVMIGDDSIVVVNIDGTEVKAYFNSCRHRGTRLVQGRGRIGDFRCPFHAWRWALDGSFKDRPDDESFSQRPAAELCLAECAVETWGGWVFVQLERDGTTLAEYLDPLPVRLAGFRLEDMRYLWHKRVTLPGNWKTVVDAFIEAYHVPGTHPQFLRPQLSPATPGTSAEMRLWPPSITEAHGRHARSRKPTPDPDQVPLLAEALRRAGLTPLQQTGILVDYQLRELRSLNTEWDRLALVELAMAELPDDPLEQHLRYLRSRAEVAARDGVRLPELSPEQIRAGAYDWLVFPNTVLLVTGNVGSLLGYRALPDGHDPSSCVFDVWSMQLFPAGSEPKVEIEVYDDWREADVGEVLSQDFSNIGEVTVGLHSRACDGLHLNLRQETSISHYHSVEDAYIFGAELPAG